MEYLKVTESFGIRLVWDGPNCYTKVIDSGLHFNLFLIYEDYLWTHGQKCDLPMINAMDKGLFSTLARTYMITEFSERRCSVTNWQWFVVPCKELIGVIV